MERTVTKILHIYSCAEYLGEGEKKSMSNPMMASQWILVLVASSVVPLIGVMLVVIMELTKKKPKPRKKRDKKQGRYP